MLIALPISGINSPGQESFGFFGAIVLREGLRVHLITGNVIGIGLQQGLEVRFGGGDVAFAEAFERDAVT
jgi:hypothetical protein